MTSQELLAEAVRLDQAGLEEEAELAYRKLLTADGNSDLVLCRLGSMALERRDLAAAIDYFRSSAGLREDPGTYCLLGVSLASASRQYNPSGGSLPTSAADRSGL